MARVTPFRPRSPKAGPRNPWTQASSYGGSPRGGLSDSAFARIVIWAMLLTFLIGWHGYGWVTRQNTASAPTAPMTLQGEVRDPWAQSRKQREILTAQEGPPSAAFASPAGQSGTANASGDTISVRFGYCAGSRRINCVVDGDTIWLGGEKIRIADIDTPEISSPGCASEKALGERARSRLHALLNAGAFSLQSIDRDTDRYGRKLRLLTRNGASLGGVLVNEGLARYYEGGRRGWC